MDDEIDMEAQQQNGEVREEDEGREGSEEVDRRQQIQQQQHNGEIVIPSIGTETEEQSSGDVEGNNSISTATMPEEGNGGINRPVIFSSVRGFDVRSNDVIYASPLIVDNSSSNTVKEPPRVPGPDDPDYDPFTDEEEIIAPPNSNKVVVFFGGDIQDTEEMMRNNGEYKNYVEWNLENIARILQRQFPTHHVVVVRPVRMQIYASFDNFVPYNSNTGHPEHTPNNFAIQHLELLLKNLSAIIEQNAKGRETGANQTRTTGEEEDSVVSSTTTEETGTNGDFVSNKNDDLNPHLERSHISLVGFSKGCVVLNQLIYEFHYIKTLTPDDRSMEGFLRSIEHMYWLDGGHNGGKNTWITSRSLLETLTRTGIRLHVHMTPYQLNDARRPYIRRECNIFSDILCRLGASISRHVHFEKEAPSLEIHFQAIAQFGLVKIEESDKTDQDSDDNEDILLPMTSSDYES